MMIDINVLKSVNAETINFNSGEMIFREGDFPKFYYQIVIGSIKLFNRDLNGKELIQGIVLDGYSVGDFALLTDRPYPINAEVLTDAVLLCLSKDNFFDLSKSNPEVGLNVAKNISDLTYFKFIMGSIYLMKSPSHKLIALMDYLKSRQNNRKIFSFQIPLTRQQMADLIGLRVETTIRTEKKMEKAGLLKIIDHKVFY